MKLYQYLSLPLILCLTSCAEDQSATEASVPMAQSAAIEEASASAPWLREHLPADTIGYLRIPSPWGMLAAPTGRASDAIYANRASTEAVMQIRQAFATDPVMGELSAKAMPLLESLASPIEVAVVAAGKQASPAANVLLSVKLRADSTDAVSALLHPIADGLFAAVEFDDDGYASIDSGQMSAYMHFDSAQQRLSVLMGMFATDTGLKQLLATVADTSEPHAMRVSEQQIDAVGQGMLLWLDMVALRPLLIANLDPDMAWMEPALAHATDFAIGWGSAAEQGQAGIRIGFDQAPWTPLLRTEPRSFDAMAAGEPDLVMTGVLPNAEQVRALITLAQELNPQSDILAVDEIDAKLQQASGLTVAEWLQPFAGGWVFGVDVTGSWQALQISDTAALDRMVDNITEHFNARHTIHQHGGQNIHHLAVHGPGPDADLVEPTDPSLAWMEELSERMPSHVYWYVDAGWMYATTVPQPLIERIDRGADLDISQWLAQTQSSDRAQSLISVSSMIDDVPRTTYLVQLEVLQFLADVSAAEIDMFALPTAQQLALPSNTPVGAELSLDASQLSLQLNYELTPVEGLGAGGGMATIAAAGVVLAIAIPAYQDYTLRTHTSTAVLASSALKIAISEHYFGTQSLPQTAEELGMELPLLVDDGNALIDIADGAVVIRFQAAAGPQLAGRYLYLLPEIDDGSSINWACAYAAGKSATHTPLVGTLPGEDVATVDERYLSANCRG